MTGLSARFPYSQSDVVRVTGASMPQVKKLGKRLLRKKGHGTGKHLGFNMDDNVRIGTALQLHEVGVDVATMHELFAAIERPSIPSARKWAWLRSEEAYRLGAAIVLVHAPRNAPARTGGVYLTTAVEAKALLEGKQLVTVIDVGAIVALRKGPERYDPAGNARRRPTTSACKHRG